MQVQEQNQEQNQGAVTGDDQARAESLAAIALQVGGDETNAGAPEGVPAAVPMGAEQEAKEVIEFGCSLFVPLYPSLAQVWTPEVRGNIATAAAPLMEKYGVTLGGIFDQWGAEIRFAMVAFPVASATVGAIKHDNAARKAAAEEAERKAKEKAGNKPVEAVPSANG